MSIKLYITAIDSRDNGTAVTLFEDYQINFFSKEEISQASEIGYLIGNKIEEVEKINEETTRPF